MMFISPCSFQEALNGDVGTDCGGSQGALGTPHRPAVSYQARSVSDPLIRPTPTPTVPSFDKSVSAAEGLMSGVVWELSGGQRS